MSEERRTHPPKIISKAMKNKFLDLVDSLNPDPKRSRIAVRITDYSNKPSTTVSHYLDEPTSLMLAYMLINGGFPENNEYYEMRGSANEDYETKFESRTIRIKRDEAINKGYMITIANGPGEKSERGIVSPVKGAPQKQAAFFLKDADIIGVALVLQNYIQAWTSNNFKERKEILTSN